MQSVEIIIVAAGSGLRYGASLPKQFCMLGNKPMIMHTIERLKNIVPNANITLVLNHNMEGFWRDLCQKYSFHSPRIVYGGATRWESVHNALTSFPNDTEIIMIHDGVRPLVDKSIIDGIFAAMADTTVDGAIPAIHITDSLRHIQSDGSSVNIDRSTMRAVQTPQAFRGDRLRKAYSLPYNETFTDDASVMEAAGFRNLKLTPGSTSNIKITNPGDIAVAELMM